MKKKLTKNKDIMTNLDNKISNDSFKHYLFK